MSHPTYDVVAIGNAIVDILAQADDAFIESIGVAKGSMQLVDAQQSAALTWRLLTLASPQTSQPWQPSAVAVNGQNNPRLELGEVSRLALFGKAIPKAKLDEFVADRVGGELGAAVRQAFERRALRLAEDQEFFFFLFGHFVFRNPVDLPGRDRLRWLDFTIFRPRRRWL